GDSTTMEAPTIGSKVGLRCQPTEEVHDPWVFVPSPREPSPGLTLQVGSEATQDKGKGEENASQQGHGLRRRWTAPNGSRLSCGRLARGRTGRWKQARALQGPTPRSVRSEQRRLQTLVRLHHRCPLALSHCPNRAARTTPDPLLRTAQHKGLSFDRAHGVLGSEECVASA